MKSHPIIFDGESVRAILDGRKTMTRRLLSPAWAEFGSVPPEFWKHADLEAARWDPGGPPDAPFFGNGEAYIHVRCHQEPCARCQEMWGQETRHRLYPRHDPGDRLWVREAHRLWCPYPEGEKCGPWRVRYRADGVESITEAVWDDSLFVDPIEAGCDLEPDTWRSPIHMPRWASRITLEVTASRIERLQDITEADAQAEGIVPLQMDGTSFLPRFEGRWFHLHRKPGTRWEDNPWVVVITFNQS